MRLRHYKESVNLLKQGFLAAGLIIFLSFLVAGCSSTKSPVQPLTSHQVRALAFHTLSAEHVIVLERGNQVDVLIPTEFLFQMHSTNLAPFSANLLDPLEAAIKTYDVESVHVQGIMPLNQGRDEKLLTLARAGVITHALWYDGESSEVPIILGSVRSTDLPDSDLTKGVQAPLIWVHWSYVLTPRMYD